MSEPGQHRLMEPIPACDCKRVAPLNVAVAMFGPWAHRQDCAILVERRRRLHAGVGGTR